MWGITPFDHALCRIQYRNLRYEGPLTPPSTGGTLLYPGVAGGMNWGSVAIDEINNLMVVNSMHNPNVVRLFPRNEMTGSEQFGIGGSQLGTPYAAYSFFFLSPSEIQIFTSAQPISSPLFSFINISKSKSLLH